MGTIEMEAAWLVRQAMRSLTVLGCVCSTRTGHTRRLALCVRCRMEIVLLV